MADDDHTNPAPVVQQSESTTEFEEVEIHPEGDVFLVTTNEGGKETRIRVLAAVLSLASPVFKRMLSPKFKEGQTLRAESQVIIPLPDDDTRAMIAVCEAIHMRQKPDAFSYTVREIIDITALTDKYDCSVACWSYASYWLGHVFVENDEALACDFYTKPAKGGDLLAAALVLKDHSRVIQVGRCMLEYCTSSIQCSLLGQSLMDTTAGVVFAQLEHHRSRIIDRLRCCVEQSVARFLCSHSYYEYLGTFLQYLVDAKIWRNCSSDAWGRHELIPDRKCDHNSLLAMGHKMAAFAPSYPWTSGKGSEELWSLASKAISIAGKEALVEIGSLNYSGLEGDDRELRGFETKAQAVQHN